MNTRPHQVESQTIMAAAAALGISFSDGLQVIGSSKLAAQNYPQVESIMPLLILLEQADIEVNTHGPDINSTHFDTLAKTLQVCYPPNHEVTLIAYGDDSTDVEQGLVQTRCLLSDLAVAPLTNRAIIVYVPPLEEGSSFSSLLEIVAHLRAPNGCPWDREQTMATLRHDLLDEASELLEAIDGDLDSEGQSRGTNTDHIIEEMGDLLLLPSMMAQIAMEDGRFQMGDVLKGIVDKLIRRHPHVFGAEETDNIEEIVVNWDAIKAEEKASRGEPERGPLDGIPAALPSLEKARKMQSKAQKAGLLLRNELGRSVTTKLDVFQSAPSEKALGELLWSLVALSHINELNAENALRSHVVHFYEEYR